MYQTSGIENMELTLDLLESFINANKHTSSVLLLNPKYFALLLQSSSGLLNRSRPFHTPVGGLNLAFQEWKGMPIIFTDFVKEFYFVPINQSFDITRGVVIEEETPTDSINQRDSVSGTPAES